MPISTKLPPKCCDYQRVIVDNDFPWRPYLKCDTCDRHLGFDDTPGTPDYEQRRVSLLEPIIVPPLGPPTPPPSTSISTTQTIPRLSVSLPTPPKRQKPNTYPFQQQQRQQPYPPRHPQSRPINGRWHPYSSQSPRQPYPSTPTRKSITWSSAPTPSQQSPSQHPQKSITWSTPPAPMEPTPPPLPAAMASMRQQYPPHTAPMANNGLKGQGYQQPDPHLLHPGYAAQAHQQAHAQRTFPEPQWQQTRMNLQTGDVEFETPRSSRHADPSLLHGNHSVMHNRDGRMERARTAGGGGGGGDMARQRPLCACNARARLTQARGLGPDIEVWVCGVGRCGFYVRA